MFKLNVEKKFYRILKRLHSIVERRYIFNLVSIYLIKCYSNFKYLLKVSKPVRTRLFLFQLKVFKY